MRRVLLLLFASCLPVSAGADPVDLLDPTPRWIEVRFEVSPRDRPGQAATVYTAPVPAWIEPVGESSRRRVVVDREYVESALMTEYEPVPGSFRDFVWVFDGPTGAVSSAAVSGKVRVELDMGLFRSTVEAQIDAHMATGERAGFLEPRSWLGQKLFHYCDASAGRSCTLVPTTEYVPSSGYVNAVGSMQVRFGEIRLRTFSPLGEALFSEIDSATVAASARPEAAFRVDFEGDREADLAGMPAVSAAPRH